ncbi:helix-turn-helix domain containing protein [Kribbella qitaiheensis]|uniref:Helix-turn-helix domain containing protein n=1 Tax=Kribbella qitaiheensis TaxID=1544730 RepID=A0A7G6WTN0_9ACTN|nr:helix-turn-helix domain containing protein [Kribbella qitaiheensis]
MTCKRNLVARRAGGESLRTLAGGTGIGLAVVHRVVSEADAAPESVQPESISATVSG